MIAHKSSVTSGTTHDAQPPTVPLQVVTPDIACSERLAYLLAAVKQAEVDKRRQAEIERLGKLATCD